MLYCMLHCRDYPRLQLCIASLIFRRMKEVLQQGFLAQRHLPYSNLITRIALHLKVNQTYDFSLLKCLDVMPRYLDLPRLFSARFIGLAEDRMHYLLHDHRIVRLPWRRSISSVPPTWMLPPEEDFVIVPSVVISAPRANPDDEDP